MLGEQTGSGFVTNNVGGTCTTKFAVAVQLFEFVNVITVVPGETAVTSPVAEIVAIPGFDDTQAFDVAGVVFAVSVELFPTQADKLTGEIIGVLLIVTTTFVE